MTQKKYIESCFPLWNTTLILSNAVLRIDERTKMKDTINFCNAISQLCCELCLHFLHSIGDFHTYFLNGNGTNDNLDFELELSSSSNNCSVLELDLTINQPRLVHEPSIQQSMAESPISTHENQQRHGRLTPIDEENEEGVPQVTDGRYAGITADDPNRSTVTLISSTNLPPSFNARPEPLESDPSSMQELHFDLVNRPSSCGLM